MIMCKVEELLSRIMVWTSSWCGHRHWAVVHAGEGRRRHDNDWVEIEMLALLDVAVKQWAALYSLLEKCLKAPVAGALWYRFFELVPRKWYQRLRVNQPVPKAPKIHEKYSLWLG